MLGEFKSFIARGNVIDLAVAVVIGAAFGKIVTALVDYIIMPPIGLLLRGVDFTSLFVTLDKSKGIPVSLADAKAKGIPVFGYGAFLNETINFIIVAFAIFIIVRQFRRFKGLTADTTTRDCPYCKTPIPIDATRCKFCTSQLAVV